MSSVNEQIQDLAQLLEEGLLTQSQFEHQRDAILALQRHSTGQPHIGSYQVLEEIGQGGMGAVYRGRHRTPSFAARQGGDVAIKVLHDQYSERAELVERFEREAALGMMLKHSGIVRVHELLVDGGRVGLVMDLVEGQPLSELIGTVTGPIPWERARPMLDQLLNAIGYAHRQGVIHRDLKPENIMVCPDGDLKILDFGIAKDLSSSHTQTGTGLGTVDYMAPEQYIDAKAVDLRADIYGLGMTLYEMLAGRLPWHVDASEFNILEKKKNGEIPPPTKFYPHIPPEIVTVVMRMLEPTMEGRYADTGELGVALQRAALKARKRASTAKLAAELARREAQAKRVAKAAEEARIKMAEEGRKARLSKIADDIEKGPEIHIFPETQSKPSRTLHIATLSGVAFLLTVGVCSIPDTETETETAEVSDQAQDSAESEEEPEAIASLKEDTAALEGLEFLGNEDDTGSDSPPASPVDEPTIRSEDNPAPVAAASKPTTGPSPAPIEREQPSKMDWTPSRSTAMRTQSAPEATARFVLMLAPSGTFLMGPTEAQRQVSLTRPFYVSTTEVTQELYRNVTGQTPSAHTGCSSCPVERVNWYDAIKFCNALSALDGLDPAYSISGYTVVWNHGANGYRLPTEAEWEYAAHARERQRFAGSDDLNAVAWYRGNSPKSTQPVGKKAANAWGLYDMSGNVFEWTWDTYSGKYSSVSVDPRGPTSGNKHVLRGGSFLLQRSPDLTDQYTLHALEQRSDLGFRVVRNAN